MEVMWLFEVAGNNWSTKNVTWSSTDYIAKVYPSSFSGITMRWDISGSSLIAPNDVSFEVDGTGHGLESGYVTIRLVVDGVEKRTWIFKVKSAVEFYGKTKCNCVDFLQDYLEGSWPNTPHPKEVWSSDDVKEEDLDDSCIPVVLGASPYIPVMSVNTGTERYYVLGESGPIYTTNEVQSPHNWPNQSTWASGDSDLTLEGHTDSGYQMLDPIITLNGVTGTGLWRSGDIFYDMLCLYTRDDTSGFTNPIDWVEYVLKSFGVPSTYIDDTNFSGTASALADTLEFTGGFFQKKSREEVLANLLHQIDCYLVCTDMVRIHQFEGASQATITNVLSESFSPQHTTKSSSDSGRVHWPGDYSGPQDKLTGKTVVPSHSGGTIDGPSSTALKCKFLAGQSSNAAKAGILYFQKRLQQKAKISFSHILTELSTVSLAPGEVITVDDSLYGGTRNIIITEFSVGRDLQVDITGIELYYLEDWANLTTTTTDVVTDSSIGFQIASTDAGGTIRENVDWNTNLLNIPDRIIDSATVGINVTDSYLGYYDGSAFQAYIDSSGQFQFRGDASNYINWDGTTLNLVGAMTINSGSGVANFSDAGGLATSDNLDGVPDGSTHGKVSLTQISSGEIIAVGSSASININSSTFGNDGIQLQYNAGNPRAYVGDGGSNYLEFDGSALSVSGSISVGNPSGVRTDINVADGADVTGNNIADDTSNVNGTPSSDIAGWAYSSNTTYINGGNIYSSTVTTGILAFTPLDLDNDDSDNIPEGTSNMFAAESGAVKNFSSLYDDGGTLSIASSGLDINTNGYVVVNNSEGIQIISGGDISFYDAGAKTGYIYNSSTYGLNLYSMDTFAITINSSEYLNLFSSTNDININSDVDAENIAPQSDVTYNLGTSTNSWSNLYAEVHNFTNGLAIEYRNTNSIKVDNNGTTAQAFWGGGDFAAAGGVYENYSFSIELQKYDKWRILSELADAYRNHDASQAPTELRQRIDEEDDFGPTGIYWHSRKISDLSQVLIECMDELQSQVRS